MTYSIVANSVCYTQATKKGVKTYTVYADAYQGTTTRVENGREVERLVIGVPITLAKSADLKAIKKLMKQIHSHGNVVLEVTPKCDQD